MAFCSRSLKQFGARLQLSTHMEVVPLTLELSRGVDLVGHDASDGLQWHVSLELSVFEGHRSLELFPCHVDCLREIPSANSCIPFLSAFARIFLFHWQRSKFLCSIFSGKLSITFNISTIQTSSLLRGYSVHAKHICPTFSTFSIHSAIFWWRMS